MSARQSNGGPAADSGCTRGVRTALRAATTASLLALAILVPACALPVSDSVEVLRPTDYPEIFGSSTTATATTANVEDPSLAVDLYFVASDQLERVERFFPRGLNVNETLQALAEPPTDEEAAQFDNKLVTLLPDGLNPQPLELNETTGVYTILVSPESQFRQLAIDDPRRARLIASQITCTMSGLLLRPSENQDDQVQVTGVILYDSTADDAQPIMITDSFATLIDGPLEPRHFNECKTGADLAAETNEASTTTG